MSWSHGYQGDVYYTGGATSQSIKLPVGTKAFYLYVEPNPFAEHTFEVIADGVSSGKFISHGESGAKYVGVHNKDGTISSITIRCLTGVDFATGEYGWATGETPERTCIKGAVKGPDGELIDRAFVIAVQLPSKDKFWALTDVGGYRIECPEGQYIVIAIKRPYSPAWQIVTVPPDGCAVANFDLK
jgi:hypothetical protein